MTTLDTTPQDAATQNLNNASAQADKGPGTRRRLLDTAAELFASKGYRNVAIRDICQQACANIAAVNYHFGGKDKLHRAAIDHARERAINEAPAGSDPQDAGPATPEQKLRKHLRSTLSRAFAEGPSGWYMQIVLRELVDPTPALRETIQGNIAPHQRRLEAIIAQTIHEEPDSDRVKDIASAILATIVYFQGCRPAIEHLRPGFTFDQQAADRMTDTLTAMVVGSGLTAI